MEGDEGGLSNERLKKITGSSNEVDYKNKSGTAWSHSYLNQKPWHPLSYPNQRRKWIAEQIHSQRRNRSEEVAREYAQEQEFFRQTSLISKKDKDKMETMQAVSFMYIRPPGYNPESAKAAELEDERMKLGDGTILETGAPARVKPFGVEVRNVKCLRCGNYGHQSGDRECPLKDVIMPNEESRLKRDDPLTAIMAHVDPSEPLKWELKRQPGNFSPPRGGFKPDDPNQQIVAEDIFDEYGGFLCGDSLPELLTNFSSKPKKKSKKKSKHKRHPSPNSRELRVSDEDRSSVPSDDGNKRSKKEKKHKKKQSHSIPSSSDDSELDRRKNRHKHSYSSEDSERDRRKNRHRHSYSSEDFESDRHHRSRRSRQKDSWSSEDESDEHYRSKESQYKHSYTYEDSDSDRHRRSKKSKQKHSFSSEDEADKHLASEKKRNKHSFSSKDEADRHHASEKKKNKRSYSSEDSDAERHCRSEKSRQKHSNISADNSDKHHRSEKSRSKYSYSSEDSDADRHRRSEKSRSKYSYSRYDRNGYERSKHRHH
ncbi:hypothetical protein JRO89_XS12G0002100 [Xanthoceras sorbifolium]|uniref:CBF1-interacting co-repressor CIR N-terminal domain-containing protein n=1 Tax=Xanthoceras sorbifolium TaxID=99658 RepID=A0ABQ8HA69_9ROSI|nr:hypothetical protein JRO89_XS12G0002100 [Xanthoceras sorbifolium]